jgi:hypothetical protein
MGNAIATHSETTIDPFSRTESFISMVAALKQPKIRHPRHKTKAKILHKLEAENSTEKPRSKTTLRANPIYM